MAILKRVLVLFLLVASIDAQQQLNLVMVAQAPLASGGSTAALYTGLVNNVFQQGASGSLARYVSGVTPIVAWNVVDTGTTAPSINWTTLDADLNAWLSNGAPYLGIIFAPAIEGGNNNGTPAYVFTTTYQAAIGAAQPQDIVVTGSYRGGSGSPYGNANGATGCTTGCDYNINTCVTAGCTWTNSGNDTSGLPVSMIGEPIVTAWESFVQQVYIHFSSACATGAGVTDCTNAATVTAKLKYIKFGPTQGGEASVVGLALWPIPSAYSTFSQAFVGTNSVAPTTPTCHLTGTGGVLSYLEQFYALLGTYITTYNPSWIVVESLHSNGNPPNASYADCQAIYAKGDGLGFGTNGLEISDQANYAASNAPLTPDLTNCTSDWCYNVNAYWLNVPANYLQTLTITDPSNGYPPGEVTSGQAGSLVTLLTFASQRHVSIAEIYPCDAMFAFATAWSGLPSTGNGASLTNCQSWYNQSSGGIIGSSVGAIGAGYAVNDTGTVTTGGGNATYIVTAVVGGGVSSFNIVLTGTGYSVSNGQATAKTSGSGNGAFTVNVTAISPLAGSYNATGGGAGVNNQYAEAIQSFTSASPAGTATLTGNASVTGKASIQ
jgi:hypothetical protein